MIPNKVARFYGPRCIKRIGTEETALIKMRLKYINGQWNLDPLCNIDVINVKKYNKR